MFRKKLNLYWYKLKEGNGNFGDELSPYIIRHLSGLEIRRVTNVNLKNIFIFIARMTYRKIKNQYTFKEYIIAIQTIFFKKIILSIGSIIDHNTSKKAVIWGSGFIDYKSNFVTTAKYLAVRGKLTQSQLSSKGVDVKYLGDPAILIPLVYNEIKEKKYEVGIIPHHLHYSFFKEKQLNDKILLIDLTNDIETIIDNIRSCTTIISSSLHGLIVSHSYAIPAIWIDVKTIPLYGSFYKFIDYYSSIDEDCKVPYEIEHFVVARLLKNLVISNCNIEKIHNNILSLQKDLLSCAPFNLKEEYV